MRQFGGRWAPYLYVAPIVVLAGALLYYTVGFAVWASLTDWNGLTRMDFIGLENYERLFQDRTFYIALRNTLVFMVATVFLQTVLGLLIAVIAKERMPGANFFKAIFFLPIAMAPAIIATVFKYMFEANYGSLNETLRALGLLGENDSILWLGADLGVWSIVVINVFAWMGFSMMVYFSGLMSIPDELYEASSLDGAGWWRRLFSITVPSLKGTTGVLILLGIVGSLKTFDTVWLTTQGGPGVSTHFLSTFLYQERLNRDAGYSSAIGIFILVAAFVLSLVQTRLSSREK
ncbi:MULTISPECIES: carbohydrate ABC transporter permease [unclassified Cellulomonas]|jgi:raffinose/stachyose/melibiose transport system permease protein|uniref:carbohydrate ABC transporter permease n=1 Tax=unclassified Cellulomonas TaxID=2620175 RepID=UPI001C309622|nr:MULTISPECIES: sugar ABC transporter permease [unclassified Cellulomonas]MBW0252448.1 sugar ABC transporter permease [Cellulomonas sp. PS-H5]